MGQHRTLSPDQHDPPRPRDQAHQIDDARDGDQPPTTPERPRYRGIPLDGTTEQLHRAVDLLEADTVPYLYYAKVIASRERDQVWRDTRNEDVEDTHREHERLHLYPRAGIAAGAHRARGRRPCSACPCRGGRRRGTHARSGCVAGDRRHELRPVGLAVLRLFVMAVKLRTAPCGVRVVLRRLHVECPFLNKKRGAQHQAPFGRRVPEPLEASRQGVQR